MCRLDIGWKLKRRSSTNIGLNLSPSCLREEFESNETVQKQTKIPYDCHPKTTSLHQGMAQSMNYLRKVALGTKSDSVSQSVSKNGDEYLKSDSICDLPVSLPRQPPNRAHSNQNCDIGGLN